MLGFVGWIAIETMASLWLPQAVGKTQMTKVASALFSILKVAA